MTFFESIWKEAKLLTNKCCIDKDVQRNITRSQLVNISSESQSDIFRIDIVYPILDRMLMVLKKRFSNDHCFQWNMLFKSRKCKIYMLF